MEKEIGIKSDIILFMNTSYPFFNKVKTYKEIEKIAEELRTQGKKIVMVSGCYDIVHLGHVQFLLDAKAKGDVLIVSVASDGVIRQLKGPERPVMDQQYRASMLASLIPVDYVVIDDEPLQLPHRINFEQLLSIIKPNFFAVNNTDNAIDIEYKKQLVSKYGAELIIIDIVSTYIIHTSEIVEKIKKL